MTTGRGARRPLVGLAALALLAGCAADRYPVGDEVPGELTPPTSVSSVPATTGAPARPAGNSGGCALLGQTMPIRPVTISSYQVAVRLHLFLWQAPPDNAFLEAQTRKPFATSADVAALAGTMLDDPRGRRVLHAFYERWLGLAAPRTDLPGVTPELAAQFRVETDELIAFLTRYGGNFADLLLAPFSFLNDVQGPFYGVPVTGGEVRRVDLPPERQGILTHASWLLSHPGATARGLWVSSALFCDAIPMPPAPSRFPETPDAGAPLTSRERLEQATAAEPQCQACHALIDPPGFLFESFDPAGRFRTTENGRPVNTRARVQLRSFEGALEGAFDLARMAAGSCYAQRCFARQWLAAATGSDNPDGQAVEELAFAFRAARLGLRDLILAVVQSPPFLEP
jgi:hypothetical protein